ncbi:MAG: hypothetical protein CYPHOPRED_005024 [Cyphobasidiales sp. Tagirdzhanova-0007]|nr:MAG: hypothetical protein CYPHOPRED_005024 [Cyphobasidiales sp. Tagirdzhanova-0007]
MIPLTQSTSRLDKYGVAAVKSGKITKSKLDELTCQEGAHENAIVHLLYFLTSVLYAQHAGVPNATINKISEVHLTPDPSYGGVAT